MTRMKEIIVFSDGSSLGNPGPGGWGAIVHDKGNKSVTELGGRDAKTTNNRMEMMAALEALLRIEAEAAVTVFTDSQYLINGITKWVYGWQASGWMTKNKMPVLNKDLWQKLVAVCESKDIEWHYVEGHAGIPGNERVDEIATSFASGSETSLFSGNIGDYPVDIGTLAPAYADKKDSSVRTKAGKAYSYVSMVDGKIEVHKTWAECERRVKGLKARFKKTLSKAEEESLINDWLRSVS